VLEGRGVGEGGSPTAKLGLGSGRASTARPSRASYDIVLRFLGTRGTLCRAGMAPQVFY
jgi:hypothetical protein